MAQAGEGLSFCGDCMCLALALSCKPDTFYIIVDCSVLFLLYSRFATSEQSSTELSCDPANFLRLPCSNVQ